MENTGLNNPKLDLDPYSDEQLVPGTSEKSNPPDELKPTSKGVEKAKKRLRAFSIQKKSSLSPIPLPKPMCNSVGAVGTVFIGKLASSKPAFKPGGAEDVLDPKKPPRPPKPGTSKLQNADYLNIQKKTLSEIEAMKRKMELVDLGIPLGLIGPALDSDKAMPTKAMPPIKSMLLAYDMRVLHPVKKEAKKQLIKCKRYAAAKDPAKVDEIIREAKKTRAEGKVFKFNYEKLLPSYQNPFQRNKDKEVLPPQPPNIENYLHIRDRRKDDDNLRRYSSHKDEKRGRDWHADGKERLRARTVRDKEREQRSKHSKEKSKRDVKSKESNQKSKERVLKSKETSVKYKEKNSKSKDKIDTINLSDDDDDVQEVIVEVPEKDGNEADVNLKDFVVCDSWSENEEKSKDPTPKKNDKESEKKESQTTPVVKDFDPIEQLKRSLIKDVTETPVEVKVEKLMPVTDSFKFEIEDENDEETLDIFAEHATSEKYAKKITIKKDVNKSPVPMRFDYESKDTSVDGMDESFLESVIAEIKQEDIDEAVTQDKGLVEYDISPKEDERDSVTPELDDRIREMYSSRSDNSDGFKSVESVKSTESGSKSTESGYKSTESGYKSTESNRKSRKIISKSTESHKLKESGYKSTNSRSKSNESHKSTESNYESTVSGRKATKSGHKSTKGGSILKSVEPPRTGEAMAKSTVDSLETWSFVLKICQPLLFRHDKNICYKETQGDPKLWFAENPKICDCVKDRSVVYEELEMCKMDLVDSVYGRHQIPETVYPAARSWYQAEALAESAPGALGIEREAGDTRELRPTPPPHAGDEMVLDREYQKFMEAVWPEVEAPIKSETPRCSPVKDAKKRPALEPEEKKKKMRLSSEGWSQESEVDQDVQKKKRRVDKVKRKRKLSSSITESDEPTPSKKRKPLKKERKEKAKSKVLKQQRYSKKYLKKLKEKQIKLKKKRLGRIADDSEVDEHEKAEKKRKERKLKKKKLLKQKKKTQKKKKAKSSSSSSDSESDKKSKKKQKRKKHKKRKQSTSESNQSDELFDANILKNIKTERLTDDENFSNKKHREIINVKQLQNDFVSIQIKKEIEDVNSPEEFEESFTEEEKREIEKEKKELVMGIEKKESEVEIEKTEEENSIEDVKSVEVKVKDIDVPIFEGKCEHEFKEPEYTLPHTPQIKPISDENLSQCSSQESIISVKETPYEKDDSHLRPSSQNSNYNFHDVMQSEGHDMGQSRDVMRNEGQDMSQSRDVMRNEGQDMSQSRDVIRSEEHMSQSRDVMRNEGHDMSQSRDMMRNEGHDMSQSRDMMRNEGHDMSRSHDVLHGERHDMGPSHGVCQSELYEKGVEMDMEGDYEQGNYEMYEQMAMEYQSDVASQRVPPPDEQTSGRIETVVRTRNRGEIKCDWRAGDPAEPTTPTTPQRPSRWGHPADTAVNTSPQQPERPSRWGLKPSEVNIVLTGGHEAEQTDTFTTQRAVAPAVYKIQSLANRTDNSNSGYDEAYMDMYGASDRLQYGDCFSREASAIKEVEQTAPAAAPAPAPTPATHSSLDDRINLALRTTVLGVVAKSETDDGPDKGILVTKSLTRSLKRVSFADGYKPGQDSDTEDPPVRKKKKSRRVGCPWPCPTTHADHVSLWDALPPPPPPPGSPPPPPARAPPAHLLRSLRAPPAMLQPPHPMGKFDPNSLAGFMPPETPQGLISFMPPEPPPGLISF